MVLTNHFDNDNVRGTFGGALDNQQHIQDDVYGQGLFITLVFIIVFLSAYAMWFLADLMYLHFYFIYRTIRSDAGSARFTTLDYLHEQRKKKMSQAIEAARAKYGDNDLAAADIQEQEDFYNYNRANYQYHDEIDMTGNATTELNIQHGHSEEHLVHIQEESGGLHCTKACGCERLCYKLERFQIRNAGMDTVSDENSYFQDNYRPDPNAPAAEDPAGSNSSTRNLQAQMLHNPDMVRDMYEYGRASFFQGETNYESPPDYGIHINGDSLDDDGARMSQSFGNSEGGIQMDTFRPTGNPSDLSTSVAAESALGNVPAAKDETGAGGEVDVVERV